MQSLSVISAITSFSCSIAKGIGIAANLSNFSKDLVSDGGLKKGIFRVVGLKKLGSKFLFGNNTPGNLLTGFGFFKPYWLIDLANACIVLHLLGRYQLSENKKSFLKEATNSRKAGDSTPVDWEGSSRPQQLHVNTEITREKQYLKQPIHKQSG
ncbi:unnamed protein product [Dovyalis caffra]|uniref:Uncharacterized protein n=1 Tax=Dovyalis caffra TaxID=77055 RepID=A0AAV1QTL7_9ROSI|nr:unnamed protein product [Dovyalis caffra]